MFARDLLPELESIHSEGYGRVYHWGKHLIRLTTAERAEQEALMLGRWRSPIVPKFHAHAEGIVVADWVDGSHNTEESERTYNLFGKAVRSLHKRSRGYGRPDREGFEFKVYGEWLDSLTGKIEKKQFPNGWVANWKSLLAGPKSPVLCHGDLSLTNTLWKGKKLVSFIDFEDAVSAPPEYDLSLIRLRTRGDERWASFLEGYGRKDSRKIEAWECYWTMTRIPFLSKIRPKEAKEYRERTKIILDL